MKHLDDFLKRNRELAEGALEAPWTTFQWGDGSQARSGMFNVACDSAETVIVKDIPLNDASFIAASRASLPLALEMLEEAIQALNNIAAQHKFHINEDERRAFRVCGDLAENSLAALEEKAGRG